ncbi:MAG: glycosyltransferase [bacterium]
MSEANYNGLNEVGISFVVVNFNMSGLVYRLVERIQRHVVGQFRYEIIMGDNSTDQGFRLDDRFDDEADAVLVRFPTNEGFVKAAAALLSRAKYKYVVMLHPDVDFKENCISQLIGYMEEHPKAGIVSPNLLYPDGSPCSIRLSFATPTTECKRVLNLMARGLIKRNVMRDEHLWDRQSDVEVDMVMSVCMVIRNEVLLQIGPINSRLWTYYFNDWLGLKIRQVGYTCHYLRDAVAIHYERFADPSLYSREADSAYKMTPIPVEGGMQKDRFIFLRDAHSGLMVFVFKIITSIEYFYMIISCLPRYRKRRQDIIAYRKALKTIFCA